MKRNQLENKKFGMLYVQEYIGNGKYKCLCDCGTECDVFATNLVRNHTTSCGCIKKSADLSGKIFGCLKAIERADSKMRGDIKRVQWKCECTRCGKIVNVYADSLTSGYTTSCGCINKDKDIPEKIKESFVDGTQISKIQSIPTAANKSGVVGVNWDKSRNKWQVSIRFRGHKYNLGRYEDFKFACGIRKQAENKIWCVLVGWPAAIFLCSKQLLYSLLYPILIVSCHNF